MESDCDYEIIAKVIVERRPRIMRERRNFFTFYDEEDFRCRFRISKKAAWTILELIRHKIKHNSDRYINNYICLNMNL